MAATSSRRIAASSSRGSWPTSSAPRADRRASVVGVSFADIALVAGFVLCYSLFSGRLARTVVTGPMVFVAFGILVGPEALDLIDLDLEAGLLEVLAEITLMLVLFSDATRVRFDLLRHEYRLPARLLGIGMPLTVGLGTVAALRLFGDLQLWEAALVGAILAPTDAALGQAVMSNDRIPVRVRQALNVESGLNDGIAAPVVTLFLALAAIQLDVGTPGHWAGFGARADRLRTRHRRRRRLRRGPSHRPLLRTRLDGRRVPPAVHHRSGVRCVGRGVGRRGQRVHRRVHGRPGIRHRRSATTAPTSVTSPRTKDSFSPCSRSSSSAWRSPDPRSPASTGSSRSTRC
ncbi:MAG: cation:proton antiporter [Acidimicrobiia bacterium]|nr:cation:proton antiporter [Acidimicrobiia bacterium]